MFGKKLIVFLIVGLVACSLIFTSQYATGEEQVKLIWWDQEHQENYWPSLRKLIKKYESLNPNIRIELQPFYGELTDYETKIIVSLKAGKGPDILGNHDVAADRYVKAAFVVPAPDYFAEYVREQAINEGVLEGAVYGGKVYGAPLSGDWQNLFYNKNMFQEAGLDPNKPPVTWDEAIEHAKKLTKYDAREEVERAGLWLRKSGHPQGIFAKWTVAFFALGGKEFNEDYTKTLINSAAGYKAMQLYHDALYKHKVDGFGVEPGDVEGFAQGLVAMFWRGSWVKPFLDEVAPDMIPGVDYGVAHTPKIKISSNTNSTHPIELVTKDSEHPEEAFKFLYWVMQPEQYQEFIASTGLLPFLKCAAEMPEIANDPIMSVVLTQPNVVAVPELPRLYEMENIAGKAIEVVMYNKLGVKEALDKAAEEINKILAEMPESQKPR